MLKQYLTKKIIAGTTAVALASGGGAVVVDRSVVTDKEVYRSINQAITEGKVPAVDLTKTTMDQVAKAYLKIAGEYGVDMETKEPTNVYEKIRDKKATRGEKLQPKTNAVLPVQ